MPLTVIKMIVFSNQRLLAFSLYDLHSVILTIRKQIIAFKKGSFAPPAPPTERQAGCLLPSPACLGFIQLALEFTESLLNILSYPQCMIGPTMVGLEEKVSK